MSNAQPQSARTKKIFIVEDHPAFREGLIQIIGGENDLSVCGRAETVEKALPAINRLKPDLALVDITLPGKSGLQLIRELRSAGSKVKLLVVSMHDEAMYADRVLRAGGDGYIMKQADPHEIVHAVRDVLAGHLYVSDEVMSGWQRTLTAASKVKKKRLLDTIHDEDLELLELLGFGKSDAEIVRQLKWSRKKLDTAYRRMRRDLKLKSMNALIRYAVCWVESSKQ